MASQSDDSDSMLDSEEEMDIDFAWEIWNWTLARK